MSNQDRATTEQAEAGAMLPKLPPHTMAEHWHTKQVMFAFTADQMRAYAQAAIDALTRKGGEAVGEVACYRIHGKFGVNGGWIDGSLPGNIGELVMPGERVELAYTEPTRAQEGRG